MQNQIFRVSVSPTSRLMMRAQPVAGSEVIARLPHRQAVARLDPVDYDGWYFVFADTPGDGLYTGYVSADHLSVLDIGERFSEPQNEIAEDEAVEEAPEPISEPPNQVSEPVSAPVPADPKLVALSPNFSLWEFIQSATAQDRGLDNSPSPAELEILKDTAANMEKVRRLLDGHPIKVTSAFRSQAVNSAVGGVENSSHRRGYAVDFVCPNFGTPFEICQAIIDSPLMEFVDQVIQERNRWVHISFDLRRRREVLSYFVKDGKKQYFNGLFERHPESMA
jgi:zinc D-Ala-D-Ala carboxypeptidase